MPAKGQKLTDEQKQQLAEARAKSKEKPVEATDEFVASQQAAVDAEDRMKAEAQERALAEAEAMRKAQAEQASQGQPRVPTPVTQPSYVPTGKGTRQSVMEWGPYDDYVLAETPYGRFGVEKGYVMFFEAYQYFDSREQMMKTSHRPIYIWYGEGENDPNFGKNRDQLVRGFPEGVASAPPAFVESQAVPTPV